MNQSEETKGAQDKGENQTTKKERWSSQKKEQGGPRGVDDPKWKGRSKKA